jgi:transcriptional regulator with XRE-family HTH domain
MAQTKLRSKKKKVTVVDEDTQEFIDNCETFFDLGSEIRQRRIDRGLTIRDVAEALDISLSVVNQIEKGVQTPGLPKLDAIARYFDLPSEFVRIVNLRRKIDRIKANLGLKHIQITVDWDSAKTFVKG